MRAVTNWETDTRISCAIGAVKHVACCSNANFITIIGMANSSIGIRFYSSVVLQFLQYGCCIVLHLCSSVVLQSTVLYIFFSIVLYCCRSRSSMVLLFYISRVLQFQQLDTSIVPQVYRSIVVQFYISMFLQFYRYMARRLYTYTACYFYCSIALQLWGDTALQWLWFYSSLLLQLNVSMLLYLYVSIILQFIYIVLQFYISI